MNPNNIRLAIRIVLLPVTFPCRLAWFLVAIPIIPYIWVFDTEDMWEYTKKNWWRTFNPFKL